MEQTIVRVKDTGVDVKHVGFYGNKRRKIGDVFPLDRPNHFSKTWMAYVSGPKPAVVVKREKEAAIEDKRIADMRASQAAGSDIPPKIVLEDDEIEGGKTEVGGKGEGEKASSVKDPAPKKRGPKKKGK